jgi:hypothetical protein
MRTRSGRHFSIAVECQPAQNARVTRASKRTWASAHMSPCQPAVEACPAHKRPRASKAATIDVTQSNISPPIDLTQGESPITDDLTQSMCRNPDKRHEEGSPKTKRKRGGKRTSKHRGPAEQDRQAGANNAFIGNEFEEDEAWTWERVEHGALSIRKPGTHAKSQGIIEGTIAGMGEKNGLPNLAKMATTFASVMFTLSEAKLAIDRARRGASFLSNPPYTLQTGEYLPFPVTRSYHLGAMGRYGNTIVRHPSGTFDEHLNDYVLDWGTYFGKRINEVPRTYIESVLVSPRLTQLLEEHRGLREALLLYRSNDPRLQSTSSPVQSYTLPLHVAHMTRNPP